MDAHPRHHNQAEGVDGRYKVKKCNMNRLDVWRNAKWRENEVKEI